MKIFNPYDFYQAELHLSPEYKALNGYLNTMDLSAVQSWLTEQDVKNNHEKMGQLYEHLVRKSIVGFDKTPNSDEEVKARDLTVLPYFSFDYQIRFLIYCMDCRFDSDYLKILSFDKQNFSERESFSHLVQALFHRDDFTGLDILYQNLPEELMQHLIEQDSKKAIFYLDNAFEKNNPEYYELSLSQSSFRIKDELIFSYSPEKMQWLEIHHIAPPTTEQAQELAQLFFEAITEDEFYQCNYGVTTYGADFKPEHLTLLQQAFKSYKAKMLYSKLSNDIENDAPIQDDGNHDVVRKMKI